MMTTTMRRPHISNLFCLLITADSASDLCEIASPTEIDPDSELEPEYGPEVMGEGDSMPILILAEAAQNNESGVNVGEGAGMGDTFVDTLVEVESQVDSMLLDWELGPWPSWGNRLFDTSSEDSEGESDTDADTDTENQKLEQGMKRTGDASNCRRSKAIRMENEAEDEEQEEEHEDEPLEALDLYKSDIVWEQKQSMKTTEAQKRILWSFFGAPVLAALERVALSLLPTVEELYVGICSGPFERMFTCNRPHKFRYNFMAVLCCNSAGRLKILERELIALLSSSPHTAKLKNRSAGGEGIRESVGFLYLCFSETDNRSAL